MTTAQDFEEAMEECFRQAIRPSGGIRASASYIEAMRYAANEEQKFKAITTPAGLKNLFPSLGAVDNQLSL